MVGAEDTIVGSHLHVFEGRHKTINGSSFGVRVNEFVELRSFENQHHVCIRVVGGRDIHVSLARSEFARSLLKLNIVFSILTDYSKEAIVCFHYDRDGESNDLGTIQLLEAVEVTSFEDFRRICRYETEGRVVATACAVPKYESCVAGLGIEVEISTFENASDFATRLKQPGSLAKRMANT